MSSVTELIGILQPLHDYSPRTEDLFQLGRRIRNKVPAVVLCYFDGDNFRSALLHFKGKETAGGTNLQHALSPERDLSQVLIHPMPQIPFALHHSVTGEFHRVVKVAIGDLFYLQRKGERI